MAGIKVAEEFGIEKIFDSEGKEVDLEILRDKIVLVYFSASWCPPCRTFSPILSEFAKKHEEDIIVLHFNLDQSEQAMFQFVRGKHFYCLPFKDRKIQEKLGKVFDSSMIPTLGVIHPSGKAVTDWGRSAVLKNPSNCVSLWKEGHAGVSWYHLLKPW